MIKKAAILGLVSLLSVQTIFAQQPDLKQEKIPFNTSESYLYAGGGGKANKKATNYGANFVRFAPVSVLDIGIGVGLSYERLMGKDNIIGVILPFNVLFPIDDYSSSGRTNGPYLYFTPGVKIYPFGHRKVSYSLGPNLMFGYGKGKAWVYTGGPFSQEANVTKFRFGMLVNNYLTINATENFNVGIEAGLGIRYVDQNKIEPVTGGYSYIEKENGIMPTGQFNINFGIRF